MAAKELELRERVQGELSPKYNTMFERNQAVTDRIPVIVDIGGS